VRGEERKEKPRKERKMETERVEAPAVKTRKVAGGTERGKGQRRSGKQ